MFGVQEGHTIFCAEDCVVGHHEVLVKLVACKRNDPKSFDNFKQCVLNMVAQGWDVNSDIPDKAKHFRFPLVHWAAVYGKLAILKWLIQQKFDVAATNTGGETALHRLIACQAHERAVDPRRDKASGRRYSLANIVQVFTKVLNILTDTRPQMLVWYDYTERNTPLQLCLKLLNDSESRRLIAYYECLFKVLCERLVNVVTRGRLSEEFVRSALSLKDSSGNTLWHVAAVSRQVKVVDGLTLVLNCIQNLDLCVTNSKGDTPCMLALKNSFPQLASLIEEYKSSTLMVPVVKMEVCPENEQCCCEPKGNVNHKEKEPLLGLQDFLDKSGSSHVESSPVVNTLKPLNLSITDEQSFTDPPQDFPVVDQQKVVLTNTRESTEKHSDEKEEDLQAVTLTCPTDDSEMQVVDGDCDKNGDLTDASHSCDQEQVVENQIDLCLSVTDSLGNSQSYSDKEIGIVSSSENQTCMETHPESTNETTTEAKNSTRVVFECEKIDQHDDEPCSRVLQTVSTPNSIQLPSPPASEDNTSSYQAESMSTPILAQGSVGRAVNLTPVLLINLLSEPDVSEKFQSLLKEVITGDTEMVGSTQSTLQQLVASKAKLENDIRESEESLQNITTKKALVVEKISKLQLELDALENSEETTKLKVNKLKQEQDSINGKVKECESTCNHLKRRLSDCAGALDGLSPKVLKKS